MIRYFVCRALGIAPESWWSLGTYNCGMTQIRVLGDGRVRMFSYNDTTHLTAGLRSEGVMAMPPGGVERLRVIRVSQGGGVSVHRNAGAGCETPGRTARFSSGTAIRLTIPAIDSRRMVLGVKQGKGHQDRYLILSPTLLALLRDWWRLRRPQHLVFGLLAVVLAISRRRAPDAPAP